jgi:cellulose synthase/poly-beta-1,6-N-acetylglucosamine synthase-like glycosyltransferase
MLFFYCCVFICAVTIILNIYLLWGLNKIEWVSRQPVIDDLPSVAVIVAMRNEEADLEKALQSVCHLNYPNYRIVVVNDRSTDRTADILLDMKTRYPQINMVTVTTLPDGWLGKNNALYQGYLGSTEEWMLFTDADIVFHPDTLSKTLSYAVKNQLDHLAVLPEAISPSPLLNSFMATFAIMLMIHLKPWDAKNPKRKRAYVGIGAFNMVRRTAYEKMGTHERIKLRPDDDLQLGSGYVCLEWYKNARQFSDGLLKNAFSASGYSIGKVIFDVTGILVSIALPMPVMFIFGDTTIRLMAAAMLLFHILYMVLVPPNKWWFALMIPLAGFFMAFTFLRAAIVNLKQGGIYWRDSFYSLEMLRGK